jgi:hypothetical protein
MSIEFENADPTISSEVIPFEEVAMVRRERGGRRFVGSPTSNTPCRRDRKAARAGSKTVRRCLRDTEVRSIGGKRRHVSATRRASSTCSSYARLQPPAATTSRA